MPIDPIREAEAKDRIEREFAQLEASPAAAGILEVLRVYGNLESAVNQTDAYLTLLNPAVPNFSTTSSSNSPR